MTLAEFLQQLVAAVKSPTPPNNAVLFILTQITGDPKIVHHGQVWVGQGYFGLSSDGERLEGLAVMSANIHEATDPPPPFYEASLSLDVNLGTLTVHPVGGLGGIRANHLHLQYFNGVLYGTATHFGYDPDAHIFEVKPGPVYTMSFRSPQVS